MLLLWFGGGVTDSLPFLAFVDGLLCFLAASGVDGSFATSSNSLGSCGKNDDKIFLYNQADNCSDNKEEDHRCVTEPTRNLITIN